VISRTEWSLGSDINRVSMPQMVPWQSFAQPALSPASIFQTIGKPNIRRMLSHFNVIL
jgi:hypothetical protein